MNTQQKLDACIKALEMIKNWDESSEDLFDDPGDCASQTLKLINQ